MSEQQHDTQNPATPSGAGRGGTPPTPAGAGTDDPQAPSREGLANERSTPHAGFAADPQRPRPPQGEEIAGDATTAEEVVDGEVAPDDAGAADPDGTAGASGGSGGTSTPGGESAGASGGTKSDGTGTDEAPEEGVDGEAVDEDGAPAPTPEEPDWKDRYLRSVAELDNVRKRARRDAAAGEVRGVTRLARELLPAMDNLDRALQHVEADSPDGTGDPQLIEGLRIVHREMHAALAQAGIESYDPTGQEFDPRFHEALTTVSADDSVLPGTVVTVYQPGYRRGDDVLRAAKVVVAG